jgi:hypothetical protein
MSKRVIGGKGKAREAQQRSREAGRRGGATPPRHLQWKLLDPAYKVLSWHSDGPAVVIKHTEQGEGSE